MLGSRFVSRKFSDALGVGEQQPVLDDDKRFDPLLGLFERPSPALRDAERATGWSLDILCLRHFVHGAQDRCHRGIVRVHEDTGTLEAWHQALHEFQPLRIDFVKEKR